LSQHLRNILARQSSVFNSLDPVNLDNLVELFSVNSYYADQYIFHQGDEANQLYIILSGKVSIETYTEDGKVTQFIHLGTGEVFGEFAVLDAGLRSAGARILHKTELASLTKSAFHDILDDNPLILKSLLSFLIARLRNSNNQIESLVTLSLLQRTAQLLLSMSKTDGHVLLITQKQLSERLFASREKVNAKLKELETKGVIKCGHRNIEIVSVDQLENLSV